LADNRQVQTVKEWERTDIAADEPHAAHAYAASMVDTVRERLVVLDADLRVVWRTEFTISESIKVHPLALLHPEKITDRQTCEVSPRHRVSARLPCPLTRRPGCSTTSKNNDDVPYGVD
jgi:hypothetical protein